jgi:ABC-type transport system involved in Fe-S cluster assembly fused permease/ATPase subunit
MMLIELVAFRVVPSIIDILVCIGVFATKGRRALAGITLTTIAAYLYTTAVVTEWRNR